MKNNYGERRARVKLEFNTNYFWRILPLGMRRRWWLFRAFDLFVCFWPIFKARKGLVIVRMDGIGDMVLFRNALDHYENVFGIPKSEITIVGCKSWSPITNELFEGYQVFTIDEHSYGKSIFYRTYINFCVRFVSPEIVVSDSYFRRALIADSLVWVMNAPNSIVSYPYINEATRIEFQYYLSLVSRVVDTGLYPTHELVRHANFLTQIGGEEIAPCLPVLSWVGTLTKKIKSPYIVLNPGSNEFGRRWPLVNYIELATYFLEIGYRVVFVGKEEDLSKRLTILITKNQKIINLIGKTNLAQLFDIINRASLIVSNDTGPAHVAIGLGTSTIVIVGGGHFGSFVPYPEHLISAKVRFLYKFMECYHCFWRCDKRTKTFESFPCVSGVLVEDVKNSCNEILKHK